MEEEFFNQRVIVKAQRGQCSRCSLADAAASIRQLLDDADEDIDEGSTADEEIATLHLTAATLEDLAGIPHPPGWLDWFEKQKEAAAAAAASIVAAADPEESAAGNGTAATPGAAASEYVLAAIQRLAAGGAVENGEANGVAGHANGTGEHEQRKKKRKKDK
ncbi:hypothetical protein ACK3TF_004359 [Chlorella vulgaris]